MHPLFRSETKIQGENVRYTIQFADGISVLAVSEKDIPTIMNSRMFQEYNMRINK